MEYFKMIPQCKGIDLSLSNPFKQGTPVYWSKKFDGNYVQIHKKGGQIVFFTSGGKEFFIEEVADSLMALPIESFIIEAEYISNTEGKLGSRGKSTTTTYRTRLGKGLTCPMLHPGEKLMLFDILDRSGREELIKENFSIRMPYILDMETHFVKPVRYRYNTPSELAEIFDQTITEGWEGLILRKPTGIYIPAKRVASFMKVKGVYTVDLKCIGTETGKGRLTDKIGSLVLTDGVRRVSVGSGLNDMLRDKSPDYFIGKTIEIMFERIENTYIHPVFVAVREDK